jgi:hypothetical protein
VSEGRHGTYAHACSRRDNDLATAAPALREIAPQHSHSDSDRGEGGQAEEDDGQYRITPPGRPDGSQRLASGDMGHGTTDDEESALAPPIPSFASLRGGGRRSPADLLVSRQPAAVQPVPPSPRPGAAGPPEWADLWGLGLRVARWCLQPITTVRRLIG